MKVPFLDLPLHNTSLSEAILKEWKNILCSASFIGGPYVEKFETEFSKACETKHCISVSSGTDALRLTFTALGIQPGDEVITAPNTFIATTEAITQAGGKVVFCDIDIATYSIDPQNIENLITPKTVGIVPIHLYGQPADMDAINEIAGRHGLWVVEDSCQAHLAEYKGKKAGSLANAAAFSFYPGKNLGACGEAGAVTTDDSQLAAKIKALRDHGQTAKYYHDYEGYNARCDTLQASALSIKLPYLQEWCDLRREKATLYCKLLHNSNIILPTIATDRTHVFHLFVILVEKREKVIEHLAKNGIMTGLHYPLPLHMQKAYEFLQQPKGTFPATEQVADRLLSLPMYPELTEEQVHYVCSTLNEVL